MSDLINKGIKVINATKKPIERKTVIVVGTARGGTSLIAGALHHLGIYTGEKSGSPVFEDIRLAKAFEEKNEAEIKEIVSKYNQLGIWAFKRPSAIRYLPLVHKHIDNPCYIFIFKDAFSVANRANISGNNDVVTILNKVLKEYQSAVDFIEKCKPYAMMLSYDKIINNKEELIASIEKFLECKFTEEQLASASRFITPNPSEYLNKTNRNRIKVKGRVQQINNRYVDGWCFYPGLKKRVIVDIFNGEVHIGSTVANHLKKSLVEHESYDTDGKCGFRFDFEQEIGAHDFKGISVKVSGAGDVIECSDSLKEQLTS